MTGASRLSAERPEFCPCGHVLPMCHRVNAAKWCPPSDAEAELVAVRERAERLAQEAEHPFDASEFKRLVDEKAELKARLGRAAARESQLLGAVQHHANEDCEECADLLAVLAEQEKEALTEREETAGSDGSDSGTPDERLHGTAVPPRTTSRSVSAEQEKQQP